MGRSSLSAYGRLRDGPQASRSGSPDSRTTHGRQMTATAASPRKLRYAYMDHWRVDTPQGQVSQYSSVKRFDAFLKQVAALGFEAIETFDFHLGPLRDLFGSLENAR